jgi:UDP-N-acetylmuramoyl-L-alanyl-D-glutamate--2,6-diaminopimelate ligase
MSSIIPFIASNIRCVNSPFPINLGGFNIVGHLLPFLRRHGADVAVITSDNPRTEVPSAIVEEIEPGVVSSGIPRVDGDALATTTRGYTVEVDRRAAIGLAIGAARAGDTVLIAGKGHEDYQILGSRKVHFDDREEARAALARLGAAASAAGGP